MLSDEMRKLSKREYKADYVYPWCPRIDAKKIALLSKSEEDTIAYLKTAPEEEIESVGIMLPKVMEATKSQMILDAFVEALDRCSPITRGIVLVDAQSAKETLISLLPKFESDEVLNRFVMEYGTEDGPFEYQNNYVPSLEDLKKALLGAA